MAIHREVYAKGNFSLFILSSISFIASKNFAKRPALRWNDLTIQERIRNNTQMMDSHNEFVEQNAEHPRGKSKRRIP